MAAALVGCADDTEPVGSPEAAAAGVYPALEMLVDEVGADVELFQVTATIESIELVVAADGQAEGYRFWNSELTGPEPLGAATGATFIPGQVAFDADAILATVRRELDFPVISRFEVLGSPDGALLYSAEVLSDKGGVLLVDLAADGRILSTAVRG